MKNKTLLLFALFFSLLAGVIGSLFNASVTDWYLTLNKPSFNPPSWIFAPVWTALFILIGISLYLILTAKDKNKKPALIVFVIQWFLNIFWSYLFFGLHNPFYAFIEIILLLLSIIIMAIIFYRIDKRAAYLLIPYILWVSFAAFLNFTIWRLN